MMLVCGAKFEEHSLNISRDVIYDVINFLICIMQIRKYLYNENRYSKKENSILLYFEKPFK